MHPQAKAQASALLHALELIEVPMKIFPLLVLILLIVDAETNIPSITAASGKDLVAMGESKPTRPWASLSQLKKVANPQDPRAKTGCWFQPWICNQETSEASNPSPTFPKRACCKNRCIDVSSDVNNCGFCGIRCLFTWQCCDGLCINTMMNPFHCGNCYNRCSLGVLCFQGMCGYAEPFPPFPFPPCHPNPQIPLGHSHPPPTP